MVHVSDEELIQASEGELAPARAREVELHLDGCARCRGRRQQLEQVLTGYIEARRAALDPLIPAGAGAEARLRAGFASARESNTRWLLKRIAIPAAAAGLLVILFLPSPMERVAWAASLPNAKLTPGATREVSREQLCALPADDDWPAVPAELALRVFREYGIAQPQPKAYEMDYLITPALGGAERESNLWPQPYEGSVWTANVKDALEDHLRNLVCSGKLDLAVAQQEMASNWIHAYQKHFGTKRPLAEHVAFRKDTPWE